MLVNPNGSRWWRFKYRYEGKERGLSLGVYPDVSLKRARAGRDEARRMLIDGVDPSANRQADKQARGATFQAVANEWLEQQAKKVAPMKILRGLQPLTGSGQLFPSIRSNQRPMSENTINGALRRLAMTTKK